MTTSRIRLEQVLRYVLDVGWLVLAPYIMDTMDVDNNKQKLELKFILLNEALAHGDPTFRTLVISSSCDLSQLRKAIHVECSRLLKDIDPASLKVYKTDLDDVESDVLLQQLEAQKVHIDVAEWRTTLLRGLALLSHYFPKQPNKTAIHLIVDCTEAGKLLLNHYRI
jgi:Crinkler effector protein N-terminal domain